MDKNLHELNQLRTTSWTSVCSILFFSWKKNWFTSWMRMLWIFSFENSLDSTTLGDQSSMNFITYTPESPLEKKYFWLKFDNYNSTNSENLKHLTKSKTYKKTECRKYYLYSWCGTGGNLIVKVLKSILAPTNLSHAVWKLFNWNNNTKTEQVIEITKWKKKKKRKQNIDSDGLTSSENIGSKYSSPSVCNESRNTSNLSLMSTINRNQCWLNWMGKKSCNKRHI